MRRMQYPTGNQYVTDYEAIFQGKIANMQARWNTLQGRYAELAVYPVDVRMFLTADFHQLTQWYNAFRLIPLARREVINNDLITGLFDYDTWSSEIAEYFKEPTRGFNIYSCVYCDMAYVNAYEIDPYGDAMYDLNNLDDDELMRKVRTKSQRSLAIVKATRPYKTKADFDKVGASLRWVPDKFDKIFKPNYKYRHHFDLDHVLPKSKCRLVALSLYNFVPCCQVCNQRLKKTKVLGTLGQPYEKLSPTSPAYDFDGQVEFHVVPLKGVKAGSIRPSTRPQDYDLQLGSQDPDYGIIVKTFKLQERYLIHKKVALHWLEMNYKYTDARIAMMANSLHHPSFSFKIIKSDIFQNELYNDGSMCFSKLRRDMLK